MPTDSQILSVVREFDLQITQKGIHLAVKTPDGGKLPYELRVFCRQHREQLYKLATPEPGDVTAIVASLAALGVHITLREDGRIGVKSKDETLPYDAMVILKTHKAALLAYLQDMEAWPFNNADIDFS